MTPESRPDFATSRAGWARHTSRAVGLVIIVALMGLLFRSATAVLAEGERLALDMAEQNLRDLVWLEGKRVLAEEGAAGLERRAGSDPRAWAQDRLAARPAGDDLAGPLPAWAEERWRFDAARGGKGLASRPGGRASAAALTRQPRPTAFTAIHGSLDSSMQINGV